MKRYFIIPILYIFLSTTLFAQTHLQGKVTEADNDEPVLFGSVVLYKDGVLITGTETDFDGNYHFSNIEPGTYNVEASYVGLQTERITKFIVLEEKLNTLDIQMQSGSVIFCMCSPNYIIPLFEKDNTTSGRTITGNEIRTLPNKNVNVIATSVAGVSGGNN